MGEEADLSGSLMRAGRLCRTRRAAQLKALGLHAGQDSLLHLLAGQDGLSMGELAKNLGVRPPTVTKMVSRMSAQGLLIRENSKYDSRQNHVYLTPAGRAIAEKLSEQSLPVSDSSFLGLTQKEEKRLRKILGKILARFGEEPEIPKGKKRRDN